MGNTIYIVIPVLTSGWNSPEWLDSLRQSYKERNDCSWWWLNRRYYEQYKKNYPEVILEKGDENRFGGAGATK